jgi:hypothetical protein
MLLKGHSPQRNLIGYPLLSFTKAFGIRFAINIR